MDAFIGIPSLFISCLEYLLLINVLIFSQKNKVNAIVFIIIAVFATNHLIEFLLCQFGFFISELIMVNISIVSFLPALSLLLVLKFWRHNTSLNYLIFLPAFVFLYFFVANADSFAVKNCYYLYVTYLYPLRTELGIYYFSLNISALLFLIVKLREPKMRYKRHLNIALVISSALAVVLPLLLILFFSSLEIYAESILNKFAFFYVLGLTYFSLKNKTEFLSEKG